MAISYTEKKAEAIRQVVTNKSLFDDVNRFPINKLASLGGTLVRNSAH